MDANTTTTPQPTEDPAPPRDERTVKIGDRTVQMYVPKAGQIVALRMASSDQMSDDSRLGAVSEIFLSLFVEQADREWFVLQLAIANFSEEEIIASIEAVAAGTQGPKPPAVARKRAARKR